MIGDSITKPDYTNSDQVTPTTATSWNKSSNGFMAWALALSGQRVEVPANTNVWSFPGKTADYIYSYLDTFISGLPKIPGFVVIECGTNSVTTGATYSQITAKWLQMIQYLVARDIRVIFVPILPRNATDFPQTKADIAIRCNQWLWEISRKYGGKVAVADCLRPLALTSSTLYEPISSPAIMWDSPLTHPNTLGAYYIGKAIAVILNQWYPPVDLLPLTSISYDATNSPYANLISTSMMTSGQAATAPVTGTRPVSWPASQAPSSGLTVASSLVTSAYDNMPMTQMVLGGSYTTSGISVPNTSVYARYQYNISAGDAKLVNIQAGETLDCLCALEIDTGNNIIQCPQLEWRWDGNTNQCSDMRHAATSQGDLPANEPIRAVLRTPPHTFTSSPADVMQVNLTAFLKSVTGTYSPSATIRWGRPIIRRLPS
ncbi:SGNH/GDSL hydrolase family protein [Novosphingobium sp. EMRT-2]|uniref:SGNH/GDSL hydrolase family protein n=1 Tax=Novosphingobium sp. EMRT-2 TaxID=2571749 RepID=UPI00143D0847|nr:SGNH/GDSL hydrolase family protein [Novosphingobium sp. EMRT-2]